MTKYEYMKCPVCGIQYAVDADVMAHKRKAPSTDDTRGWTCPNGHRLVSLSSSDDNDRRRAERAEQRLAQKDDEISRLSRSVAAQKGNVTRLKHRAAAGVCPCCNRTFQNLARHMHGQHPDFVTDDKKKKREA